MNRIYKVQDNLYRFSPSNQMARRSTADNFFAEGLGAEKLGDKNKAFALYRRALDYDPSMAGAWLNIGTILFQRRDVRGAEKFYRSALGANPEYALAHFNLGCLLDEKRSFRQATEHYLEAIKIDPTCAHTHYNLALEYKCLGDYRQAIRCYRSYIRFGSEDGQTDLAAARRVIELLQKRDLVAVRSPVAS